jgi:hypothetical protein
MHGLLATGKTARMQICISLTPPPPPTPPTKTALPAGARPLPAARRPCACHCERAPLQTAVGAGKAPCRRRFCHGGHARRGLAAARGRRRRRRRGGGRGRGGARLGGGRGVWPVAGRRAGDARHSKGHRWGGV